MTFNCFYKVEITTGKKEEIWHWGYYPYSLVMKEVKELYKDGADAVILEMITQEEFDAQLPKP